MKKKKRREKGNLIINGHGPYVSFLLASCYYNEYQCNNGYCIPDVERCDGYYDCGDISDEWNCSLGKILIIILCKTVFWYIPSSLLRESCAHSQYKISYNLYCAGGRASSLGLAVGVSVVALLCCIVIIAGCCCCCYAYNKKRTRRTRTAPSQHVATVTAVTAVTSQTTTSSHAADKLQRTKADYPPPYTPTVVSSPLWFQVSLYITQSAYMI